MDLPPGLSASDWRLRTETASYITFHGEFPPGPVDLMTEHKLLEAPHSTGACWFVVTQNWVWYLISSSSPLFSIPSNVTVLPGGAWGWRVPRESQMVEDLFRMEQKARLGVSDGAGR